MRPTWGEKPLGLIVYQSDGTPIGAQAQKRLPIISGAMGLNLLVEVDGTVKSWGTPAGDGGFYGDGTDNSGDRKVPTPIAGVHDIIGAAVGYDHALLLSADGSVLGWGRNNGCALALPDDRRRYAPVPIPGVRGVKQVAASQHFSAAVLKDGTVRVWGTNEGGLLANGKSGYDTECASTPVAVEGLTGVKRIAVSDEQVLALKDDGTVWAWGDNTNGVLCDGTTEKRNRPVQMKGIANAVDIDIGAVSIVVLSDGTVWMCGMNRDGALADAPKDVKRTTPFKVGGITSAVAARTAAGSTMVRLKDGTLLGWGYGMFGSVGDGLIDKINPKPHPPVGLGPVLAHYYASNSGFGVRADGTIMAWGIYVGGPKEWALTPIPFFKVKLTD
jgi:alpha-tubulin suppressor-like RCC1 family protein